MDEYVKRSDVINSVCQFCKDQHKDELYTEWDICQIFTRIANVPPADVIDRNEGIKMGAELAAMHGSDATSQDLEKAYYKGMEEGYKRIQTMYDELIKWLREEAKFPYNDNRDWFTKAADTIEELLASCKNFEAALKDSVEECEKLQQYADLYKDLTEKSQKVATELKQQLQKSEEDNVNLTGWLAEEHARAEEERERLKEQIPMTVYVLTRLQFDDFSTTNEPKYTDIEGIFVSKDDARRYIYEEFAKFDQTPTYEDDDYYSGLDTGWKKMDFFIEEHELIGTKRVRISDNPPAPLPEPPESEEIK